MGVYLGQDLDLDTVMAQACAGLALAPADLKAGWKIGQSHFGRKRYFFVPNLKRYETTEIATSRIPVYLPISVTGPRCQLQCEHCRGKLLQFMQAVRNDEELYQIGARLYRQGCRGLLISGGSDRQGKVPLAQFAPAMRRLKEEYGYKIAVHTGLVDASLAQALAAAGIDSAMLDIIGDERTITEIYHLPHTPVAAYEQSLHWLTHYQIPVSPHVVIGLHRGKLLGEWRALEIIARYPVASLVLVALSAKLAADLPAHCEPRPEQMLEIFLHARQKFPQTPILLGCARPYGRSMAQTDQLALLAGLNGIAYPAQGTVAFATELGLEPKFSEYCCSLIFEGDAIEKPNNLKN